MKVNSILIIYAIFLVVSFSINIVLSVTITRSAGDYTNVLILNLIIILINFNLITKKIYSGYSIYLVY